jgi:DNA repair protein RecN (Recombination protein N)
MLRELHIQNLAVIEDATVEFSGGLNVFTGETGAGKSLILSAFELLLGLRAGGAELLRPGADEARVSGVFELTDRHVAEEVGRLLDQPIDPTEALLITRRVAAAGRSGVSVNGRPATASMVRQVGQLLVDIHGQHDHQYLLKPTNQLAILDGFARCTDTRRAFAEAFGRWRSLREQREELGASGALRRQQLELYRFQADDIDAADPQPGEFAELQARHRVLANLRRVQRDAGHAHAALYEAEASVIERLQAVTHVLTDLAEIDAALAPTADQVREATLSLQEASFELSRYVDRLELDPAELAEVEDRLNTLNRLIARYPGDPAAADPVESLLAYRRHIGGEIERLGASEGDLAGIDARIADLRGQLEQVGATLRAARQSAAVRLRPLVEAQLAELGMPDAAFDIAFTPLNLDDAGPGGLDAVEMLVRTNPGPGQEMRPLRKIASGGELSRIMLALKGILAHSDRISVLVFDEIDANIGGRLGSVIGQKLRALAAGETTRSGGKAPPDAAGTHQVLCITHLPQIAALADRHLRIEKTVTGGGRSRQTRTTVTLLQGAARVDELAAMMAGKAATATTRRQARELLAAA